MCVCVSEKRAKVVWSSLDRTRATHSAPTNRGRLPSISLVHNGRICSGEAYQHLSRDRHLPSTGYTARARRTLRTWAAGDFPGSASGLLLLIVFQMEDDPNPGDKKPREKQNDRDPRDTLVALRNTHLDQTWKRG